MYKVGDKVVYPHHGAGTVVKKETRTILGQEREYLTIKILHNDMTVNVPTENADRVGLRKVIDEEMVVRVVKVLHGNGTKMPKNWNRRFKYNRDKMKTGDIFELAEVVRNLSLRDQEKGLSTGEKQMFVKAKKILASELMYAKSMDEDDAAVWLDDELDSVGRQGRRLASWRRPGPGFAGILSGCPAALVLFVCALLAALAAGCAGGSDESSDDETRLQPSSFKEIVIAELKQAGLEAEPGLDLKVSAFDGPNRVDLTLDEAFAEYEADHDRKDEIVAGLVDEASQRLDSGLDEVSLEEASRRPDAASSGGASTCGRTASSPPRPRFPEISARSTSSTPRTRSPSSGPRMSRGGGPPSRSCTRWLWATSCGRPTRRRSSSASRRANWSSAAGGPPTVTTRRG